jgi:RNA polymerase sigma-70 factor (ECF subfamily)
MQNTSDSLLINLKQNLGDAWDRLDSIYVPMLKSFLARQQVSESHAEDIVQDVLVVVLRKLPEFRRERVGSFRTWLRQIAVNCLRDHRRRRRHEAPCTGGDARQEMLLQLADPASELTHQWNLEHRRHVMRYAVTRAQSFFSPQTWVAFERTALDDDDCATVARELGMTVNAVYIAKSRVVAKMRELAAGL